MLPVLPLFSLITAKSVVWFATNPEYERLFSISIRLQLVLSVILVVLALLIPSVFFPGQKLVIWLSILLLIGFYIYIFLFFKENSISRFLVYSIIAIITLNFSVNAVFYPELSHFNAAARASEEFNKLAPHKAILYTYKYASHETAFYAKNSSLQITDQNKNEVFSTDGNWIYTTKAGLDTMKQKSVSFIVLDTLPYLKMSNVNIGYLTPISRDRISQKTFLIRINHLRSEK
jgi:hypothetical protein